MLTQAVYWAERRSFPVGAISSARVALYCPALFAAIPYRRRYFR